MTFGKRGTALILGSAALMLTACAGTAPNAPQKGYATAHLDAERKLKCELTRDIEACARDRDLNAVDPLEDHGFHEAHYKQAEEAKRDRKRLEKGK